MTPDREPDPWEVPEELRRRINAAFSRMITPEMRSATERLMVALNPMLEDAARRLMESPGMQNVQDQLAKAARDQLAGLSPTVFSSLLPEMTELNQSVVGTLQADAILTAEVEILVEDGPTDSAPPIVRRSDGSPIALNSVEAVGIFLALYTFIDGAAQDSFAEAARNTSWALALMLVILMVRANRTDD